MPKRNYNHEKRQKELNRQRKELSSAAALRKFFRENNRREKGAEPSWEEHKKLLLESYRRASDS